jgi:small-conductance mechanosensitive channel
MKTGRWLKWIVLSVLVAEPASALDEAAASNNTASVMFHGRELFQVADISALSAQKRAQMLTERLVQDARSPLFNTDELALHHDDALGVSLIFSGDEMVCAVWNSDETATGIPRVQLAQEWMEMIREQIEQYRKDYTAESYIKGIVFAAIATLVFLLFRLVVVKLCRKEDALVQKRFAGQTMFKFIDGDSLVAINHYSILTLRAVLILGALIIYLNLVLSFFPWTFNLAARLFNLVSTPFISFYHAFVDNLPNLFALLVIGAIVYFILRGLKHVFDQIGEGKVRVRGFYRDWADPTYRLVRLLIIVFAAVAAFPYIPGSSSPAFKGISIFMGVLFSLGSSSAVGNIFAGLVLTYMRPFMSGDFVEISGMRGTVMARSTFSTRLRTPTNEIISIPNSSVSSNQIINFSRMADKGGVSVGTTVTIGYDVPWRTVHELLLNSAKGVNDVLEEPAPTILQLSLDDFYVQYKLIVTTHHPERRFRIRSDLHQNIQDQFALADIEIMSPHYQHNRDSQKRTVPDPPPNAPG